MENDKKKWNRRYQTSDRSPEPSRLVASYYHLAPGRKALDLACGSGQNSLYLADNGFKTDSIDISTVAIEQLARHRHPFVTPICDDLDSWKIPENTYDLIINIKFLARRLFPGIRSGLKPGGILIFDSFTGDKGQSYCLTENELLAVFKDFHIIYYEEKPLPDAGKFKQSASLVARKK